MYYVNSAWAKTVGDELAKRLRAGMRLSSHGLAAEVRDGAAAAAAAAALAAPGAAAGPGADSDAVAAPGDGGYDADGEVEL